MPRGGRKRGRGRRRRPAAKDTVGQQQAQPGKQGQGRSRRRRRRGPQGSALDRMVAEGKTTTVQTLPPDGTVLEEVISDMRSEYGTPATPQEFRLLIKVPGAEIEAIQTDPADPQEEPREQVSPDEVSSAPSSDVVETGQRGPRRRRRGRRRRGGQFGGQTGQRNGAGDLDSQPSEMPEPSGDTDSHIEVREDGSDLFPPE